RGSSTAWLSSLGLLLHLVAQLVGDRVQLLLRVARVRVGDPEGGHELEQPQDQPHVDVTEQFDPHEAARPAGQHHVQQVPNQERHRHRERPPPEPPLQLLEFTTLLYLFIDRRVVFSGRHETSTVMRITLTLRARATLRGGPVRRLSPSRRPAAVNWEAAAVNGQSRTTNGNSALDWAGRQSFDDEPAHRREQHRRGDHRARPAVVAPMIRWMMSVL